MQQRAHNHTHYRQRDGFHLIEITLREPRQLFNNLDPAPFHEKDLEASAEEYLVAAVNEIGMKRRIKLLIYLPSPALANNDAQTLPLAVHNYFAYRSQQLRRDLHSVLRVGAISLGIGLSFLFACLSARSLVQTGSAHIHTILAEGLLIMGWVAMWRPIDVFLYDWWPIARKRLLHKQLADIPIELHASNQELGTAIPSSVRRSHVTESS